MKDLAQFKPIETGTITEVQPLETGKVNKDGKPVTPAKDHSAMSDNDSLSHTDAKKAKLEHQVTFEDGKAVTGTPTKDGTPKTDADEAPETETQETPATGTTETPAKPEAPPELAAMDDASQALIMDALNHCKDQNFKAALDVLDKAIANHRKMMDEAAKHHKKMAPVLEAKKQAQILEQLRNKFIAEQAAFETIDTRKIK